MKQYERVYGSKIKSGDPYVRTADIAKAMRADIKAAIATGELPGKFTYSVRIEEYSMGRSIDISIQDHPDPYIEEQLDDQFGKRQFHRLRSELEPVLWKVKGIWQAYNYDGSDSMTDYFDVDFYGSVGFESPDGRERRLRDAAKAKARREAGPAAAPRVYVYIQTTQGKHGERFGTAAGLSGRTRFPKGWGFTVDTQNRMWWWDKKVPKYVRENVEAVLRWAVGAELVVLR
jgi:hypothetical protein